MTIQASYFEIPVHDLGRASAFYGAVFGCELKHTEIDGHPMTLFPDTADGISGALAQGESYVPGAQGVRLYFLSADISTTLERVIRRGGQVVYPKTLLGELGWVAEFEDSEGNCIALIERPKAP